MTRPSSLCLACGLTPCACEAKREAYRERARGAKASLTCRCALCGWPWTAAELGDCPCCGGLQRVRGGGQ